MSSSIKLGKLWGVEIGVHFSWFIVLFILVVAFASQFSQDYSWSAPEQWGIAVLVTLLFFMSVLVHEMAHSLLALRKGIPVKGITLFIFGGVSQISREASRPSTELLIAAIGPVSSLVLGAIFLGLAWPFGNINEQIWVAGTTLAYGNFALGVFNLVPGFPLDGGRVFRAVLWGLLHSYHRATRVATLGGQGVGLMLMLLGIALTLGLFPGTENGFIQGIWLVFIGWFLLGAASSNYKQHRMRYSLEGVIAKQLMDTNCPLLSPEMTLREIVEDPRLLTGNPCFLVGERSNPQGLLTLAHIKETPSKLWETTTLSQAMTPLSELKSLGSEVDAHRVLELMNESELNHVTVLDNGALVGIISRESLALFMNRRIQLGI